MGEATVELAAEFDCLVVVVDRGVTRLRIAAHDTARLHGILEQIETLGLQLLDVRRVAPESPGAG